MHSMYLAGVPLPSIHVAATDPLCSGRHADLVTRAIVADRCPRGVSTMKEIIARKRRIVTARIAAAIMNGIVPVEIVIGVLSVPTAIMRLKRIMRPANARVGAGHNDVLPGESERPDLRRVRVVDCLVRLSPACEVAVPPFLSVRVEAVHYG